VRSSSEHHVDAQKLLLEVVRNVPATVVRAFGSVVQAKFEYEFIEVSARENGTDRSWRCWPEIGTLAPFVAERSHNDVCLRKGDRMEQVTLSIPETVAADIQNGGATPLARRLMELAAIEAYESGLITERQIMETLEFESREELLDFFERHDVRSKITPEHLEEETTATAEEQPRRTWADVWAEIDRMPSDENYPSDLSTNKKHMEGYGEW
jgi:hypothetical protein